jgi:hypothetical protein
MYSDDIDFGRIGPRCGGKREAFEELCCQLAERTRREGSTYTRLRGAGGDGGVECFADLPKGSRVGWQAKYVFDIGALIAQTTTSLTVALGIHPTLTRYIVCFPFDLTGPTARPGRSGQEKFEDWCREHEEKAATEGRQLEIEGWPAFRLRSLLLEYDSSGGIRAFFFNDTILSNEWFSSHLDLVRTTAGPRYTPELNVQTDVGKWFAAFGRTTEWSQEIEKRLREAEKKLNRLSEVVAKNSDGHSGWPRWPESIREEAVSISEKMRESLDACSNLKASHDEGAFGRSVEELAEVVSDLSSLEGQLVADLEKRHGPGRADSPGFRQFMAEYQVSFPAANLDMAREGLAAFRDLQHWLKSAAGSLAFCRGFVLSGGWGVGKTHGVCDVAFQRLEQKLLSCVVFGHQFRGEPDPWTRLTESLGLPINLGKDGLLDALNAAAEASGQLLLLFIDAINETRPLQYWRNRLAAFVDETRFRPNLRLCFTCRTPYLPHCLPMAHGLPVVEHPGFKGVERIACTAFFEYYGLKPPVAPILQPELANPLYLLLVCETLKAQGLEKLPAGWSSMGRVIAAFLEEKEKEFAREKGVSPGARIVTGALRSIASAIAKSGEPKLRWSEASKAVYETRAEWSNLLVVEWLVGADLLIEEASDASADLDTENTVRPAFERLGDFLVASELLKRVDGETALESAFDAGGHLYPFVQDSKAVQESHGVLSALSVLIPEHEEGRELPQLMASKEVHEALIEIALASLPWRDPSSFSSASQDLVLEALTKQGLSQMAMDCMVSVAWHPSAIDATWLHEYLAGVPLAQRDAIWCGYLHLSYEESGPVRRVVDGVFDLPLDTLESAVGELWAVALLWFTAAADRRVKDRATRALLNILAAHPNVIPGLISRFLNVDDDEVRERLLLASYGALIISRDSNVTRQTTSTLQAVFRDDPQSFDNALIRDHIRCISELARKLDVLPEDCDPQLTMQPIMSEWPLELPSDVQIEAWGKQLHFQPNEFLSDFFKYSMNCLRPWDHSVPKEDMGKWILRRVARGVGYEDSGCERYDRYMLGKYGGGRGKPVWAERIGKKYQWLALYQLASRLHDHVERKHDSWAPEPLQTPLILLEERKLDPTFRSEIVEHDHDIQAWWIGSSADLRAGEELFDAEWAMKEDDLPSIDGLLEPVEEDGRRWRLLVSYPSWGAWDEEADWNDPYRQVWMHIESYLVSQEEISTAYDSLHRRNFFGRWMPDGATWIYGFAGEYPWASPYNTEPEEWHGMGTRRDDLPVSFTPSWCQIAVEWKYDASLQNSFHMFVPARLFFAAEDLWWNGQDGYRLLGGRTIFRDPSVTQSGPAALLAYDDDLLNRLEDMGLCIMWTLLGEKRILGGQPEGPEARRTFSQIARLDADGSLVIGERVFFEDYDQNKGPLPPPG